MAHLLIVDDEAPIRTLIRKYAEFGGHTVSEAEDGMAAVRCARDLTPDLVIMDIMMPELDGFSAVREIRKFSRVPVLFLSARGEEYDRINGFECGADDYVVKPFSPKELLLRVEAILKRCGEGAPAPAPAKEVYTFGGLTVDMTARIVTVDGAPRDLSPKEYDLLFYMIRHKNVALTRERLITEVWGYDFFGVDRTLDTHVKLLRKSLGAYSAHIVTLRGVGYRFDETV
ncbi:MAG: response regulator transcription factor [Clostridia bacterium]|nr:response regulator transcription factor [Clostridia bacterium]